MDPDLVFDVGLHKGEDSEFYLKKGFRVVGVEANPELVHVAENRLSKYIQSGQLIIVNAAIARTSGPVRFFLNEEISVWGTTSPEWVARNKKMGTHCSEILVNGIDFRQLLDTYGCPYYLKVDIEGADLYCIEALRSITERPKHISIESNKTAWKELVREFELLESLGYSKYKIVDQLQVKNQKPPSPAKEGNYAEHVFEACSSGLFGEEAPGNWLSEHEAKEIYKKIFRKYELFGDTGKLVFLRTVVKRLPFMRQFKDMMTVGWYDTHATF